MVIKFLFSRHGPIIPFVAKTDENRLVININSSTWRFTDKECSSCVDNHTCSVKFLLVSKRKIGQGWIFELDVLDCGFLLGQVISWESGEKSCPLKYLGPKIQVQTLPTVVF